MFEFALLFAFGFLLNLLLTPVARVLASTVGLVDCPDGRRKLQSLAIPVAGGPAVLVSVTVAVLLAYVNPAIFKLPGNFQTEVLLGLLIAATTICVVGIYDDARGLRGKYKLLGQLCAVGIVIAFGVRIEHVHFFEWEIELGYSSIPLTVFLLLGAINSLNLLDGMDGLLGSVGVIVCVTFGVMAVICGQVAVAWVAFALGGALLGFLRYNFPPASIFMGDSGSMLVGLVIGVLAIHGSMKGPATIALAAPLCVLIIPIFDTSAAIVRRKLAGRSIFSTDRAHLHHCLLQSGLSRRGALLVVSALCMVGMVGGFVSVALRSELVAALAALTVVAVLVITQMFGYNEARLILQRLAYMSRFTFARYRMTDSANMQVRIQGTIDWSILWKELVSDASNLNVRQLRLDIDAPWLSESFHARMDLSSNSFEEATCVLKIVFPLAIQERVIGRVEVTRSRCSMPLGPTVELLTELVSNSERIASALVEHSSVACRPSRHREGMATESMTGEADLALPRAAL